MNEYRALISVSVFAADDNGAARQAYDHANSLVRPDGAIGGHLELLGEGSYVFKRVVLSEGPEIADQLRPVKWWEWR